MWRNRTDCQGTKIIPEKENNNIREYFLFGYSVWKMTCHLNFVIGKLCASCNNVAGITFHYSKRLGVSQNFTEFCGYLLLWVYMNTRNAECHSLQMEKMLFIFQITEFTRTFHKFWVTCLTAFYVFHSEPILSNLTVKPSDIRVTTKTISQHKQSTGII